MWNGVGGGTIVYAAQWQRNMPSDFRVRSLDGVADDWPLTYEDLEPYYVRVEKDFGISGLADDTAFPPGEGPPLPPVPLGPAGRKVARAHNELGWHWWPAPNAIATRKYGNLNPCVQRGVCLKACRDGAKGTVDITHWPVAQRARRRADHEGHRARDHRRAGRARDRRRSTSTTRAPSTAIGASVVDPRRERHRHAAAAPPLRRRRHRTGSPTRPGMVGRRLMMHPFGTVVGLWEDELAELAGPVGPVAPLARVLRDRRVARVRARRQVGAAADRRAALDDDGVPVGRGEPDLGRGLPRATSRAASAAPRCGGSSPRTCPRRRTGSCSATGTDRHGIPGAKIVYRMSQNSLDLMHFHEARAAESLQAAGAYETVIAPQIRATGWHLLGTAVMGEDPATSVVDGFGRTHDVPNLFIFDGSTWPTSAGMNPTATIAALALRNTEALIESRRLQAVAA